MATETLDAARAAAFDVESRAEWRQAAKVGCLLSFLLVPMFMIQDQIASPDYAPLFAEMRFASVLVTALVFRLLNTPLGERNPRVLSLAMTANIGLLICFIAAFTGGGTSPRYAGLMLLMFAGSVLMPWRPREGLAAGLVLIAFYADVTVVSGRVGDWHAFVTQLFYLCTTAVIGCIGSTFRERFRRREFTSRVSMREALRVQSDFMAKMSHEIRTPVNVMVGYADILLDEALGQGGEARQLVQQIRGNGVKLRNLISDLLDFSKAQAGQMQLYPETVALCEVIHEVGDTFRPLTERKGLGLEITCPDGLPDVVTDRQRLGQILNNLMSNAVKFTQKGRIAIEVTTVADLDPEKLATFTVLEDGSGASRGAPTPGDEVAILVRDTGIGIRAPDVKRLAADYQQLDGRNYGGTGLGLSISKKLAQLLGGRIAVASTHQEGTTFAVFLPWAARVRVAA